MKVAIIRAAGKTGMRLVREARRRGYQVVAVCGSASADRLKSTLGQVSFVAFLLFLCYRWSRDKQLTLRDRPHLAHVFWTSKWTS